MMKISSMWRGALVALLLLASASGSGVAQDKAKGERPPSMVAVVPAEQGLVTPESEFVGTVYFHEVADVATETSGLVASYDFEEGESVASGAVLVRLSTDLLEKDLAARQAAFRQARTLEEEARVEFERIRRLYESGSVSAQEYDSKRFASEALTLRTATLAAEVARLELELKKTIIRAPFGGIVIERKVARGEWVATGSAVATLARADAMDVVVNVPEEIVSRAETGMKVRVKAGGRGIEGIVTAVVPRGDIATRTFPLKVRIPGDGPIGLVEGMEARVILPSGPREQAVIVPRDAVITVFGQVAVWVVDEGQARMIPVEVVGYKGLTAGVRGQGLSEGMPVVVKGNERLRPGQPVMVEGSGPEGQAPESDEAPAAG